MNNKKILTINQLLGWALISALCLLSCSNEDDKIETLYEFPSLSQGQLVDLKKASESMEGFFITTDLSDWDPSYADRGFYLYVCVRFLNDPTLNEKLNKSAIPLLIQASNHPDRPEAEAILLLHPKTKKDEGHSQFYYEEQQHFGLASTAIKVKEVEYLILDSLFNSSGRLMEMSFLKKGTDLKSLKLEDGFQRPIPPDSNTEENNEESEDEGESTTEDEELKAQNLILTVGAFAKQFSKSCSGWPMTHYTHSAELPSYLKVQYSGEENPSTSSETKEEPETTDSNPPSVSLNSAGIPEQTLIPEEAPYVPVPKTTTGNT